MQSNGAASKWRLFEKKAVEGPCLIWPLRPLACGLPPSKQAEISWVEKRLGRFLHLETARRIPEPSLITIGVSRKRSAVSCPFNSSGLGHLAVLLLIRMKWRRGETALGLLQLQIDRGWGTAGESEA